MDKDEKNDGAALTVKLDIPGVEIVAGTADKVTDAVVGGFGSFLGSLCLPAAKEMGLGLQDKVRGWRYMNALRFEAKVAKLASTVGTGLGQVHPRIMHSVVEAVSNIDDDDIQQMWAKLLLGAASKDGQDQSSLVYIRLLERLTNSGVKLLTMSMDGCILCEHEKTFLLYGRRYGTEKILTDTDINDVGRLFSEIQLLKGEGLLNVASNYVGDFWHLVPDSLGARLYARCHGLTGNLLADFGPVRTIAELTDVERKDRVGPSSVIVDEYRSL